MNIEQELATWDEKSAGETGAVYESHYKQPDFVDTLIKLTDDAFYQKGATWLLKTWLKAGNKLETRQIKALYELLPTLEHWETKLHLLQSIPWMPIAEESKKHVEAFLRTTLTDSNKFVRAWSYSGFYELALQYPEYTSEARQLLAMAMNDEAASVQARVRNIMKKGF